MEVKKPVSKHQESKVPGEEGTTLQERSAPATDQEARFVISQRDFRNFTAALDQAFRPNRVLQDALAVSRRKVRHT